MILEKIDVLFNFEERNSNVQWKHVLFREQEINKLNELKNKINQIVDALNTSMEKINFIESKLTDTDSS